MDNENLEFKLPQNAYVNFDATSLKAFMIEQLNKGGVFTDQNYEGSNLAAILDILAYYTHVLMFYLNQTSSESMFSQASIYENMNKIVNIIGYKPTGKQTSVVPIIASATSALPIGSYNIRKYSYILLDNIQYTFIDDYSFDKTTSQDENIQSLSETAVLYQGSVGEYPIYTAEGLDFESFPIVVKNLVDNNDDRFISHGTLSVYVKEVATNTWYLYDEVDSLYLSLPTDRSFELRLNGDGNYEIKFGNGIFGKKIQTGDQVSVFYILSDNQKGIISKNNINGNKIFQYSSKLFEEVYTDTSNIASTQIDNSNNSNLILSNPSNSSLIYEAETVDEIRLNAPSFLSTQIRLVTESDYEKYLRKSIPNILNDVRVVNNKSFMDGYIQYFYNICADPNKSNRVILNQVNFADSCDFNNINVFCVPSFNIVTDGQYPDYMSNNFKNLIVSLTQDKKMVSNEVVPRDPIYMAIDLGFTNNKISLSIKDQTKLTIVRERNNKLNKDTIKRKVYNYILEYFNTEKVILGQKIDISEITSAILSIEGIKSIRTRNIISNIYFDGVSFLCWNPLFEKVDISIINQNTTLDYFKFPYLYAPNGLINKIEVIDE